MLSTLIFAAVLGASAPGDVVNQMAERPRTGRLRERMGSRNGDRQQDQQRINQRTDTRSSIQPDQRINYGDDARQRIVFFAAPPPAPNVRRRAPALAVFIHGGGWQNGAPEMVSEKPAFYRQHGWAFASIGYRLMPDAPVEEQARDIGRALAVLRAQAGQLGYDPDRIMLTGHSAGAHLAALVATDPQYAGNSFGAIKGVIPIDGAGYDVAAQIAEGGFMTRRTYDPVFGSDPARHRALSPLYQAGGQDAPDWLLLYTSARDDARQQSDALAAALRSNGKQAQALVVPYSSGGERGGVMRAHREINIQFGTAGYAGNDAVLALMERVTR